MMPILLDYETLRFIWWGLLGILLIGFAITDGFDMGVAFLNLCIGRTDTERRIILNCVGPVWDGNQVWLLLGGGAIFAAFPLVYASAFSGFYFAMLLVLLSLIVRPVSFEYRNKFSLNKRKFWDFALFASGVIPPLIFGVAFGNLFLGVPFFLDEFFQSKYVVEKGVLGWFGGILALLHPFALLCGLVSLSMLIVHGSVFLGIKTKDKIKYRAKKSAYAGLIVWFILFIIGGLWVGELEGFRILSNFDHNSPSNPIGKEVIREIGLWRSNYIIYPILHLIPCLALVCCIATAICIYQNWNVLAFVSSSIMIASTISTAGVALFPFLLPSSINPNHSLTIWDASSSHLTLWLMTIVAIIFVPIVVFYTSWAYKIMRGKVTEEYIRNNSDTLY